MCTAENVPSFIVQQRHDEGVKGSYAAKPGADPKQRPASSQGGVQRAATGQ